MTDSIFDLCPGGTLALDTLAERTRSPEAFDSGAEFWDDPYVSEQLLDAHLDPNRNAASRTHDRIDAEVDWLVSALDLSEGDAILDLGCGPGLYCERFHDHGLDVTGVDLSHTALDHARASADETDREITYRRADYRALDVDSEFDAAVLVYFDFGTFSDEDRDCVLRSVRDALVPGGRVAVDVHTAHHRAQSDVETEWTLQDGAGFWRPNPHLVLTETIPYPDASAFLDQHHVVEESGETTTYRFWERQYDRSELTAVLNEHGFTVDRVREDLRGTVHTERSESLGIVGRRR